LRADEKHIRAQSTILEKIPAMSLMLTITVFLVRMRLSSVQGTRWRAQRAKLVVAGDGI